MLLTVCRNWSIFGAIRSMVGPPDSWNDANFCAPLRALAPRIRALPSLGRCCRQEAHDIRGVAGRARERDPLVGLVSIEADCASACGTAVWQN